MNKACSLLCHWSIAASSPCCSGGRPTRYAFQRYRENSWSRFFYSTFYYDRRRRKKTFAWTVRAVAVCQSRIYVRNFFIPNYASYFSRHDVGQGNVNMLQHLQSCASTKVFSNRPIQFYLNNVANIHQLTSQRTTSWLQHSDCIVTIVIMPDFTHRIVYSGIFSGRELAFTFAICYRRSVCRLSVVYL